MENPLRHFKFLNKRSGDTSGWGNERLSLPKKSAIGVALTRNSELRGCRLNLEQHSRIKTSLVGLCLLITAPSLSFSPGYAGALDTELVLRSNNATPEANQTFARLQKETLDLINGYRYNESEQKFLEMLRLLSQVYGEQSDSVSQTKKNLAVLYTEMHKYQEAESLLKSALLSREKTYGSDSPQLAEILKSLGVVYIRKCNYEEAWIYFSKASGIIGRKSKKVDPHLLGHIADLKSSQGLYKEALGLCDKALQVAGEGPNNDVDLVTGIQACQAGTYLEMGALNKAAGLYSQILNKKEALKGANDPSVADAKVDMATILLRQSKIAEAQTLINQALPIQQKTYGNSSVEVAKTLSVQSDLVLAEGRITEAKELIAKSINITEQILGLIHSETATRLVKLAKIELLEKNLAESERHCLQSLEIDRTIVGEQHPAYANDLTILASIYQEQGRVERAKSLYGQAITILSKTLPPDSPDLKSNQAAYKTLLKIKAKGRDTLTQDRPFR